MFSVYEKFITKKPGAELFNNHGCEEGEEFFLQDVAVLVGDSQFTRPICNRSFLLDDQWHPFGSKKHQCICGMVNCGWGIP